MIKASLAPINSTMSAGFAHRAQPQPQSTCPAIVQAAALGERLQACFATLKDPRVERTR